MHAVGQLEDVVKRAIELGFLVYGLTEHMPRTRKQDLYPEEAHLTPADTQLMFSAYYAHARELQAKYKDQITLLVGMETELIHDHTLEEIKMLCQSFHFDYLVGSVHHVLGYPIDFDEAGFIKLEKHLFETSPDSKRLGLSEGDVSLSTATSCAIGTEMAFQTYFDAQFRLIDQIQPSVVAHFDLVRLFRPAFSLSKVVLEKIDRNIQRIAEYGGIIEINSRAWKKGLRDAYPQRDILQRMVTAGLRFCISDDSHGPADVGMHYSKLPDYLAEMGICEISYPIPIANTVPLQDKMCDQGVIQAITIRDVLESTDWTKFESRVGF
ncbi:hypothetical protein BASA83_005200 [Batrachochytrium salamandrivorans]|nr:hypothetical protein BASA62_000876 [Batrachochytrium salamandrivorans]KAH9272395.1 hypothetical protein BASA83_005200 [Batrachochytrium salamandrivorans]